MPEPRRVLIVDDEDDIREVASLGLSLFGWDVRTAASGTEAVALAATDPPDAVLLDVMMPEMDGPSTLAALREQPSTRAVPVIFLTAKVQAGDRRRLEQLGAAVLAKPFDPVTLPLEVAERLGWELA